MITSTTHLFCDDEINRLNFRISELESELVVLREFAGGKCVIQKVIDELGPMSLWSKASLDRHIEAEIVKRSTANRGGKP
jgi:hypothetical protein